MEGGVTMSILEVLTSVQLQQSLHSRLITELCSHDERSPTKAILRIDIGMEVGSQQSDHGGSILQGSEMDGSLVIEIPNVHVEARARERKAQDSLHDFRITKSRAIVEYGIARVVEPLQSSR